MRHSVLRTVFGHGDRAPALTSITAEERIVLRDHYVTRETVLEEVLTVLELLISDLTRERGVPAKFLHHITQWLHDTTSQDAVESSTMIEQPFSHSEPKTIRESVSMEHPQPQDAQQSMPIPPFNAPPGPGVSTQQHQYPAPEIPFHALTQGNPYSIAAFGNTMIPAQAPWPVHQSSWPPQYPQNPMPTPQQGPFHPSFYGFTYGQPNASPTTMGSQNVIPSFNSALNPAFGPGFVAVPSLPAYNQGIGPAALPNFMTSNPMAMPSSMAATPSRSNAPETSSARGRNSSKVPSQFNLAHWAQAHKPKTPPGVVHRWATPIIGEGNIYLGTAESIARNANLPSIRYRIGSDTMYPSHGNGRSVQLQTLIDQGAPALATMTDAANLPFGEIARDSRPAEWGVIKIGNVSNEHQR